MHASGMRTQQQTTLTRDRPLTRSNIANLKYACGVVAECGMHASGMRAQTIMVGYVMSLQSDTISMEHRFEFPGQEDESTSKQPWGLP